MADLSGSVSIARAVLFEVTEDPNTAPRHVVAGTASAVGSSGGGQGKVDETKLNGDFRSYGNGNTRLILGTGNTRTQTLALRALTPAQLQTVRDLAGHTVCYRDIYGRRVFGAYTDIQVSEIPLSGHAADGTLLTDVGLVITSISFSETV